MFISLITLAGGLILLVVGGELLVRGSVRVAERLGVSSLIIGLTLVGFGTSMPELATSVEASMRGAPGIAIGNIAGSNIANTLLILGVSSLILPMSVSQSALTRDGSFVVLATAVFVLAGYSVGLSIISGVAFIAALIGYMVFAYRQESNVEGIAATGHTAAYDRGEAFEQVDPGLNPANAPENASIAGWVVPVLMALAGLAIIIGGGKLLVGAAIDLARIFGMSESVIGLTVVAVGTSLPELVTSVIAALRRQTDIAIGNVLGSNIYNILGIGGVTGLLAPTAFPPDMLGGDLVILLGSAVLLYAFARNNSINRIEGSIMLASYVGYTSWLLLR